MLEYLSAFCEYHMVEKIIENWRYCPDEKCKKEQRRMLKLFDHKNFSCEGCFGWY